ncbi:cellular retinaldehyde-binding/triple function domain-containing protein [Tieghemostelium lacteum]|uniref:Cellular retinaldehyde-binding/triple function domain-containing protein n=1 Tax=Tieghemostelium lacteum TaxID=361077 RepID=A0A151Z469_TIELA|nr:cellular retinaldehyde-binding/triple function domain-containing protein [Tieghemostelium lacteum]|eukprot:KYQ88760.1 cellular retinaldehyde-binding/triple function domain-containing protein [Tieghemostelium lacteum]
MSGYVGDLSDKQRETLNQLKERINQIEEESLRPQINLLDDSMILRFLRARKWKLDASYDMLYDTLVFRTNFQDVGVENIKSDMVENELKVGKSFFCGKDNGGRPVCIIRVRKHDGNNRDIEESMRYCVYVMEQGKNLLEPPIETCTLIFDMTGFSTKNMDYQLVKFLVELFQKYYPESMAKCLILNAPWLFTGIWNIIKHWLDPITASKVSFVKTKQLIEYVPKEQLMPSYGGISEFKYTYKGIVVED